MQWFEGESPLAAGDWQASIDVKAWGELVVTLRLHRELRRLYRVPAKKGPESVMLNMPVNPRRFR